MTIRQVFVSMSLLSVVLLTGEMVLAEESKRATDPTKGNKSETTAERSPNQGQNASGKKGKDSLGRPSGEPTNPGIGTANGSDSGAGAVSGGRGDSVNSPGGTSSGTESGAGTASPGSGN